MSERQPEHTLVASNGRAELTLDQVAILHEGSVRFMLAASDRMRRCYHAAKAKNSQPRPVSALGGNEVTSSLRARSPAVHRSNRADPDLVTLYDLLEREEWSGFDAMWDAMTNAVNDGDAEFNHGYLVWQASQIPSEDLVVVLEPQDYVQRVARPREGI